MGTKAADEQGIEHGWQAYSPEQLPVALRTDIYNSAALACHGPHHPNDTASYLVVGN